MLYDNEVVMLILGTGVFLFAEYKKSQIKKIIAWRLLLLAFYFLMTGWFLTVVEGFFLEPYFNILEHLSYSISAVILALWCRKIALSKKEENHP